MARKVWLPICVSTPAAFARRSLRVCPLQPEVLRTISSDRILQKWELKSYFGVIAQDKPLDLPPERRLEELLGGARNTMKSIQDTLQTRL